jgi:hypothetical protein
MHAQAAKQRGDLLRALFGGYPRHGVSQRLARQPDAGVALPEGSDTLLFLGQVDQMEVDGERPRYLFGPRVRPLAD